MANSFQLSEGWDDSQGIVGTALLGNTQWTLEQMRDTGVIIPFLSHNQDDFIYLIFQLPHRMVLGSEFKLHVHAIPEALPVLGTNDKVYWSYAYTWVNPMETIPAIGSWTTGNATTTIAVADQYDHMVYDIFTATKATSNESSILFVKLTRLGTNILDTYDVSKPSGTATANFGILYIDGHFRANKIGTRNEFANV